MRARVLGVALVTLGFLAATLYGTDWRVLREAWSALDAWRLGLVVVLHVVVLAIRTERFRRLLPSAPGFGPLLALMGASFLAINVMPLRMGELVRPYLLSQRGVPLADAALAVIIERVLDLVALLVLVLVATVFVDAPDWQGRTLSVFGVDVVVLGRATIALSVLVGLVGLFVLRRAARATRGASPGSHSSWRDLGRRIDEAFEGLGQRTPADVAAVVLCTMGSWAGALAACALAMSGFPALATTASSVVVDWAATVSAVVLVPTPGFVGAFEAGAVGGLVALGRDADTARAFALALHATQFGAVLFTGLAGFAALGISLPAAVRASRAR